MSILNLPPELIDAVAHHLDWPQLYNLRRTCRAYDAHFSARVDSAVDNLDADEEHTYWQFGTREEQKFTATGHLTHVDGFKVRILRRANECLFEWDIKHGDNIWANYQKTQDANLVLRIPMKHFEYLLNEPGITGVLARDLQLTHPPVKNVNACIIHHSSQGRDITKMEWPISKNSGICLKDILERVLKDINPERLDLPPLRIKVWKSVCPTDEEVNVVKTLGRWQAKKRTQS